MTQWREARSVLKLILKLNFKYQYRLTRYLTRFIKFRKIRHSLMLELTLLNIIVRNNFITDTAIPLNFIENNCVFVNGLVCNNPHFQLFTNDFIQFLVSLKYYIIFKWTSNFMFKRRVKLKKIFNYKTRGDYEAEDKQRSGLLPNRILTDEYFSEDVLKFCEIDYFTLSILILYEPFLLNDLNCYANLKSRPYIFNMYN